MILIHYFLLHINFPLVAFPSLFSTLLYSIWSRYLGIKVKFWARKYGGRLIFWVRSIDVSWLLLLFIVRYSVSCRVIECLSLQLHLLPFQISNTSLKNRKILVKLCNIVVTCGVWLAAAGLLGVLKKMGRDSISDGNRVGLGRGGVCCPV